MDITLFLSASLTLLLHGALVLSEDDLGPSADTLRRYLALYEQQQQQRRPFEQGRPTYPGNQGDGGYEGSVGDGGSFRTLDEGPRLPTPTQNRWTGPGQPEFAQLDDRFMEPLDYDGVFPNGQAPAPQEKQQEDKTAADGSNSSGTTRVEPKPSDEDQQKQNKKSGQLSSLDPASYRTSDIPFGPQALTAAEAAKTNNPLSDVYFVVIVAGCSAAAIFGVIAAGYCFYRFQKNSKAAAEVDYPAYGVTGPNKDQTSPNGDRRLAQSAQMYHYQHQKQQMIAVEKATTARNTSASDIDSEEENEDGDYTVYECPGLAPTGEMEVKNPLFQDDSTPMSPPVLAKDIKKP